MVEETAIAAIKPMALTPVPDCRNGTARGIKAPRSCRLPTVTCGTLLRDAEEVCDLASPPASDYRLLGSVEGPGSLCCECASGSAPEQAGAWGRKASSAHASQEDRKTHCCPEEGHIVLATVAGLRLVGGAEQALSGCWWEAAMRAKSSGAVPSSVVSSGNPASS